MKRSKFKVRRIKYNILEPDNTSLYGDISYTSLLKKFESTSNCSSRLASFNKISRFCSLDKRVQALSSSSVLKQPTHIAPDRSNVQTPMHGDGMVGSDNIETFINGLSEAVPVAL